MPDIYRAVDFAIAQSGKPYHAYGARFGLDYYDCSGLVIRSLYEAGVPLPAGISVENRWGNTVSIWNWANRVGGLVSVDKAYHTKGALLIKGRWYGYGPIGHIEFSLGDGREVGAHGSRSGIGVRTCDPSRYQDGFIIPGVDYHLGPPPPPPPPPEPTWKVPVIFLTHPDRGTWIVLEGPGGQVSFLSPTGAIVPLGMDQDPQDKAAFGNRQIKSLQPRTRNDGKPGFHINATDNAKYVPKSQI